jgi:spoIIIJ-associated protein
VKEIEISGKTIEEAKHAAFDELGVSENDVEIIILKKGRSGVLGMGAEDARIKVRVIDEGDSRNLMAKEAKKFLETLLNQLGLQAKVSIMPSENNETATVLDIEGDDLGVLIGRRGQALTSLQYIVRLIVAEKFKTWASINIDVAGYKKRRYESLRNLALRLADQVKTSRRSINLEPMPADERRIIHITLADHPDITTQSVDEGERRKVVVQLRKR